MPDILPTIDNEPAQGIQALLDTVYLWNQDVANDLIDKINELIKELDDIVTSGEIKPYSELLAPVRQYIPMFYGNGVYVAADEIETLPTEPDLSKWILVATKASTLVAGDGIDIENDVVSVEQSVLQGAAAGATAVQPGDLAQVATTGSYNDLNNKPSLGTAAAANVSDFATAAQGVKADTAVQPGDLATVATTGDYADLNGKPNLATVATSGSYNDLDDKPTIPAAQVNSDWNANSGVAQILNKPTLGTAAAADTTDFATAAQGTKADTAAQPGDVSSAISTHNTAADAHNNIISPITTSISGIEEKIPAQASSSNQLADKNFVNSSIATNTANFIGTFNSVAELEAYSGPVTNNDYAYVIRTDATGNTLYDRYKYTDATTPASWEYEYTLNNSSFTADQWAAINSHATAASIGQISTNQQDISNIQTTIGSFGDIVTHDTNEFATASQGAKADTAVQPGDLATVATSGSYNDLIDKPILGTMASETATDYYTKTAADAAFATAAQGAKADTAVQPADLATVATTGNYEDLTNKPVIPGPSVPQYETMPTASASNLGEIAQYSGVTIPDVEESVVVTQTVGSSLSGLSVNLATFVGVEQPEGDETVDFVANLVPANVAFTTQVGDITITMTYSGLRQLFIDNGYDFENSSYRNAFCVIADLNGGDPLIRFSNSTDPNTTGWINQFASGLQRYGFTLSGVPAIGDCASYIASPDSMVWNKNGTTVDLASYGISYNGTPVDGDTLEVSYTAFVAGITNGYFYKSSAEYSDPTATISQTGGSGLTDLAVDVDTFIETEQPTQDETVDFVCDGNNYVITPSVYDDDVWVEITFPNTFMIKAHQQLIDQGKSWEPVTCSILITATDGNIDSYQISLFDEQGDYCSQVYTSDIGTWGISFAGRGQTVDKWTINQATISNTSVWTKNGENVNLADYGISYSGTPTDGDTLTVAYTAPILVGYYWNQVEVQPGSGGGNAGIEWKTKVDLPAEYSGSEWSAAPYYTIAGGLPDGTYEFYYSYKTINSTDFPVGEVIFKVKMIIDNTNVTAYGIMGYVFNGDYCNGNEDVFGMDSLDLWELVKKNGSDALFYTQDRGWATSILAYNNHQAVPECFKLSAIKNIDTGVEYVATGAINLDGSQPVMTNTYSGRMRLQRLANQPYIPSRMEYGGYAASDLSSNTFSLAVRTGYGTLSINTNDSELIINFTGRNDENKSAFVPYSQEIVKATGIFAGCYLAYGSNYIYVMGVDTMTASSVPGNVRYVYSNLSDGAASLWFGPIPTEPLTQFAQVGPQGYRLGTITGDGIGNIVQYTGDTDANYTNGYFYKETGTTISVPESITTQVSSPQGEATVTIDATNFIDALMSVYGWSRNQVVQWMNDFSRSEYNVFYDSGSITQLYLPWVGTTSHAAILRCISVTYTGSESSLYIFFRVTYTPEHKEVQNPVWQGINVQPSSGGGSVPTLTWYTVSSAGTTITIADTSSANLVKVYKNGLLLQPTDDYTISGTTLTTVGALVVGDKITTEVF